MNSLQRIFNMPGGLVMRSSLKRWSEVKFQAGQIGYSVANGLPPLRHFFESTSVACWRSDAEMDPANSLHASTYYSEYNGKFN